MIRRPFLPIAVVVVFAGLAVAAAPAATVLVDGPGTEAPLVPPVEPASQIEEDEPGWDCHTMGNRICGPTSLPEGPVGPSPAPEPPTWNGVADDRLQGPDDAVEIDAGDGIATTGRWEAEKLAEASARGESEDEYRARLCAQLQAAKPWADWGCG